MFRSFFPVPRYSSLRQRSGCWLRPWSSNSACEPVRAVISIDRFLAPADLRAQRGAALDQTPPPTPQHLQADATSADPNAVRRPQRRLRPRRPPPIASPKIRTSSMAGGSGNTGTCSCCSVLFCVFWYFYKRNDWYWWSVVASTGSVSCNLQPGPARRLHQRLAGRLFQRPAAGAEPARFGEPGRVLALRRQRCSRCCCPNIIFLVLIAFFTSHYVFRWRKAMTSYYMAYWRISAYHRRRGAARPGRHSCALPRSSRTWAPASSTR